MIEMIFKIPYFNLGKVAIFSQSTVICKPIITSENVVWQQHRTEHSVLGRYEIIYELCQL